MGAGQGRAGNPGGGQPPTPKPLGGMDLSQMSDNALADFFDEAIKAKLPDHLNANDPTQRLIFAANWNDTPEVVSAAALEAMVQANPNVVELYRTICASDDGKISAKQIADSIRKSKVFQSSGKNSDSGDRCYGGGMYMADELFNSRRIYGTGSASTSNTIGAIFNDKAKIITSSQLYRERLDWVKNNPKAAKKLGMTLRKNGTIKYSVPNFKGFSVEDRDTMLAMAMGYNVVHHPHVGYYTILNRGVLTTSTKDYYSERKDMRG